MSDPSPLYHYTNLNHGLDLFKKGIHMSSPVFFNDPFDSYLSQTKMYSEVRESLSDNPNREDIIYLNSIDDKYIQNGVLLDFKVSCLSEALLYSPQWTYYADSHMGICVEYDLEKLKAFCTTNKVILGKIKYSKEPMIDFSDKVTRRMLRDSIFNKSVQYSSEREWRLLSYKGPNYLPIQDCIKRLYIGCRTQFLLKKDGTQEDESKLETLRKIVNHC